MIKTRRMHWHAAVCLSLALVFAFTMASFAQMGMRGPTLMGLFHPKVGAGAAYLTTDNNGQITEMEISIVGKENQGGTEAYWMEISFAGQTAFKYLVAAQESTVRFYRAIFKNPQMGVMEMPEMMLSRMNEALGQNFSADEKSIGMNLGTEVIMTKVGPKTCTHWQKESQLGVSDLWLSKDVYPNSIVKSIMKSKDGGTHTTELIRVITDAKTKITEEPQKMPMPER
jgi:hypothetical protein